MSEQWKPIPGWEGYYEVSNQGKVRSLDRITSAGNIKRGRLMKLGTVAGYKHVALCVNGQVTQRKVHQLVLEAFVGPCPKGHLVCHKDGSRDNNHIENLRWGTPTSNNLDTIRHGRHKQASATHCARGHRLETPNLAQWASKRGRRLCLSCARAYNRVAKHPELRAHFQEVSDAYFHDLVKN